MVNCSISVDNYCDLLYLIGTLPLGELKVTYRKRWTIEVFFQTLKGRRFNLEQSRLRLKVIENQSCQNEKIILFLNLNNILIVLKLKIVKNYLSLFLVSCFLFLVSCSLFSQEQEFISLIPEDELNLSYEEIDHLNFLVNDSIIDTVFLITISNAIEFTNDGTLEFSIPGYSGISSRTVSIEAESDEKYSWLGNFENFNGHLIVRENSGVRVAAIQIENDFFDIIPFKFSEGVFALRKFNEFEGNPHCGLFSGENEMDEILERSQTINFCAPGSCSSIIDVLVLLTPEVVPEVEAIMNLSSGLPIPTTVLVDLYLGLGMEAVNFSFINSEVPAKITYKFQSLASFNFFPTALENLTELVAIGEPLRGDNDLVIMLTSNIDDDFTLTGIASECALAKSATTGFEGPHCAFALSETGYHVSKIWTTAHEIGHLLAATHDRPSISGCPDGKRLKLSNGTLMAVTSRNILNFSNPKIFYNNESTGGDGVNNAQVISNTGCVVESYREGASRFAINIISPIVHICNPLSPFGPVMQFDSRVQGATPPNPGIGPFRYEWRYSIPGSSSSYTLFGKDKSATLSYYVLGFSPVADILISLEVTSSDGLIRRQERLITAYNCPPNPWDFPFRQNVNTNLQVDAVVKPNPINDTGTVDLTLNQPSKIRVELYDFHGIRINELFEGELSEGSHSFPMNLSEKPNGIYLLIIKDDIENKINYLKIVK